MQSDMYFLVLSGTLIDGHERDQVEQALQRLLRISPEQARSMLAGERSRIRKQLTLEKATRLRDKLAAAGAGSFIEPVDKESSRWVPTTSAAAGETFDSPAEEAPETLGSLDEERLFELQPDPAQSPPEGETAPEQTEETVAQRRDVQPEIAADAETERGLAFEQQSDTEPLTQSVSEHESASSAEPESVEVADAQDKVEEPLQDAATVADDNLELVLEPMEEKPPAGETEEDTRPLEAVQESDADTDPRPLEKAQESDADTDTRPLEAVKDTRVDKDTEEIVLQSELTSLEAAGSDAGSATQPSKDKPATAPKPGAKNRPSVPGAKRRLLLAGIPLLLLVVVGGVYYFGSPGDSKPEAKQQARTQVDSKRAITEQRLEALGRSVRAWMKFYGSGDPAQVTLDRMQQDLELPASEMKDAWGTAIRYQPGSPNYVMLSAGPDRKFGTGDDLKRELKVE